MSRRTSKDVKTWAPSNRPGHMVRDVDGLYMLLPDHRAAIRRELEEAAEECEGEARIIGGRGAGELRLVAARLRARAAKWGEG